MPRSETAQDVRWRSCVAGAGPVDTDGRNLNHPLFFNSLVPYTAYHIIIVLSKKSRKKTCGKHRIATNGVPQSHDG